MKRILTAVFILTAALNTAPLMRAQTTGTYQAYIDQAKQQIDQSKYEIERIKLMQAEYRASRNEAGAKSKDAEIKRYQDMIAIKQLEMSMYQQQETMAKQPLSSDPTIAAVQNYIRQLTFDKARLGIQQAVATQAGNAREAARLGQEVSNRQLQIQAKQQEIRLLELKAKTGR